MEQRTWRSGSFTVETAVVAPLAVFLVAALIGLTFFAHDRLWYTGAACEAALSANASKEGERSARNKIAQKLEERILPGEAPEATVEVGKRGATVSFAGQRDIVFFKGVSDWDISVSVRRIRPAAELRNWWTLKHFGEEIMGWDI